MEPVSLPGASGHGRGQPESRASLWSSILRQARTGVYRVLSPLEAARWRIPANERLPPLWLRRHTGAPSQFRAAAASTAELVRSLELLPRDGRVLDIGCGCGAMAYELAAMLSSQGAYCGFDVHGPSIDWCRNRWQDDPRLTFHTADISSPYSAGSRETQDVRSYAFPVEPGSTSLVLAKSVFTHMYLAGIDHYLSEIRKALDPLDGKALVTFFLFEGSGQLQPPAFPYPPEESLVRWKVKRHPLAAIAYGRELISRRIELAGLEIESFIPGFWPGSEASISGQDQLILRRKREHGPVA